MTPDPAPGRFGDCGRRDDAGPWVLHALGGPEADDYAAHLEACAGCRREVARLQPVADALPLAVGRVDPPAELGRRIMDQVWADAELRFGPARARPEPRRRWLRLRPALAGAIAAVLIALGIGGGILLAGGDDARTIRASAPPGASVSLKVSDNGRGELSLRDMPTPPPGRVYQVWTVTGNAAPVPTQTRFTVSGDGDADVTIDRSLAGADQVLVSDEPPEGSRSPTGAVVVGAELT